MRKNKIAAALFMAAALVQAAPMTALAAQWQGTTGAWWYQMDDGSYATGWQNIGGRYYHFDAAGYMQTGWQYIDGKWYYFDAAGFMQTGWQYIGGKWYYFYGPGDMHTGWLVIDQKTYYMFDDGSMAENTFFTDGSYYYLAQPDGTILKNTTRDGIRYDEEGCAMQRDASGAWTYIGKVEDRILMAEQALQEKYLLHEYKYHSDFVAEVHNTLDGSMSASEVEDFINDTEELFWDYYDTDYDSYEE